jgi:hypothetical protein
LNPASIAWELLPYSFVADWFVDIGSFLRSVETAVIYANRFRSGYYSVLLVKNITGLISRSENSGSGSLAINAVGFANEIQFRRVVYSGFPLPTVPRFKANLGSRRLLSAAALLTQKLHR